MKSKAAWLPWMAAYMAGASTLGCPTADRPPTEERETVETRSSADRRSPADDLLLHLSEQEDGAVTVTTGTEHFGKGSVVLSVHGNGRIEIVNHRSGKTTRYEGTLTTAEVEQLGVTFAQAGFTTLKSAGPPRRPGDTPVFFELHRAGKQLFRRELWHGDRYERPGLDLILKRNDAIVSKVTSGELPY